MRAFVEIILALFGGLAMAGGLLLLATLATCALAACGCRYGWRWLGRRRRSGGDQGSSE